MTPWTAAHQASLCFTISRSLLKLMPVELVMPFNLLLLPSIFPSLRVFSNKSALRIRWPKYWSFTFSISPSYVYSGLISYTSVIKIFSCLFVVCEFDGISLRTKRTEESFSLFYSFGSSSSLSSCSYSRRIVHLLSSAPSPTGL